MEKQQIVWVDGSKGGVGKSMVAAACIDFFRGRGDRVTLVECDTANPDVHKSYGRLVERTELIDLDEADGWIHFVNVCDATPDSVVVVNTAARNSVGVKRFGGTLESSLEELGRRLVVLWVINRQRDSLELLRNFLEVVPSSSVHVVRNGHFGPEEKFELYNGSKTRSAVEEKGGKSVTFPELADRVADELYTQRLSICEAVKSLPLGNRAELNRWRTAAREVIAGLVI